MITVDRLRAASLKRGKKFAAGEGEELFTQLGLDPHKDFMDYNFFVRVMRDDAALKLGIFSASTADGVSPKNGALEE